MKCFVLGCANSNKYCGELSFFSIPKDPDLQKIWLDAIGRNSSVMLLYQRICSDHFRKEDIVAYGNRCTLKEGVVPSLHLPNPASYPFTNDMRKNVKDFFFKHSIQPVPFEANTSKKAIPSTSKNHPYDTKAIPSTSKNYPDDVSKQILEKVVDTAEADIPVILPARLSCEPSTSAIVTKSSKLKRPYSRILEKSPNEDSASPSSATSSAKRRMVKAFHSYSKSPLHYVKEIKSLRKRINILKTKKDTTQRTSCRRKKAIQSLNEIVVDLRKRNALSTDAVTILESTFSGTPLALMKRMIYTNKLTAAGKKGIGISYPPELKSFAMTLQFYSAKAYRYVRQTLRKIEKKIQSALKIVGKLPPKDILITLLMKETQDFLLNCHIFPTLEEHIFDYAPYEINHKKRLIDLIISTYSGIRMHSIANKVNESVSGEKIRKKCAKLVLFKNQ